MAVQGEARSCKENCAASVRVIMPDMARHRAPGVGVVERFFLGGF
jgi:hypothetical protein